MSQQYQKSKKSLGFLILSIFMSCAITPAWAIGSSGFELATNSAGALGRGGAVTADPEDATTISSNPAGLVELEGNQVTLNTSLLTLSTNYEATGGVTGSDGATHLTPIPATFLSLSTPIKDLKVGLGVNAPFGLSTQYSSTGNFRYTANYNEIKTIAYNASLAYKPISWLSVGTGLSYIDSNLKQVGKFNTSFLAAPGFPDAPFELDASGSGWGWNLGALITPDDKNTIGIFYRSRVRTAYEGTFDADNLTALSGTFGGSSFKTSVDTDITLPDSFSVGYNYKINPKWDVEVDATWTNWSTYDQIDILFGQSNAVLNAFEPVVKSFRDTISINIGTTYKINDNWAVSGGYFYYEMAANKNTYDNGLPDGDRHALTVGLRYYYKLYAINLSYVGEIFTKQSIDNTVGNIAGASVDGDYSSYVNILSLSITRKF